MDLKNKYCFHSEKHLIGGGRAPGHGATQGNRAAAQLADSSEGEPRKW